MSIEQVGNLLILSLAETQMVVSTGTGLPEIVHFGSDLGIVDLPSESDGITGLLALPRGPSKLAIDAPATVCPLPSTGWSGRAGLRGHRSDQTDTAPRFSPGTITVDGDTATICCQDSRAGLTLTTILDCMPASVRVRLQLTNTGALPYYLDELTTTVPVPTRAKDLQRFSGRWSNEFQTQRTAWSDGALSFDNRSGRTSHDRVPALFVGEQAFTENRGDVWGFSLGWSGSAIASVEALSDGRRVVQMGELLHSGDIVLQPGETHASPWLDCATSDRGLNGISQAFHRAIRSRPGFPTIETPRPVTLNTWEAVYFDHDFERLKGLVARAEKVGCERFVLDDGWFHGRRDDTAGLGDWWVDDTVWPDGLDPLITAVKDAGMEFGIWFEPEMVNRNSELYRTHPSWVLADEPDEAIVGRQQLVLNLGLSEVRQYLFEKLDAVLSDYDIRFVKWDMNRDLVPVSNCAAASTSRHIRGFYSLWDQLRDRHPQVEFESCASGGGRADLEMLSRAERIWTSDSNDALERQRIQRGFSQLFPPEVMGAHIGPPRSHTSGRTHSIAFRAATAFFGHLGIEWNLLDASAKDLDRLTGIIKLHKQHRALLHGGTVWRLDLDDDKALAHMVVDHKQTEALLSYSQLDMARSSAPVRIRLSGLLPDTQYRVELIPLTKARLGLADKQVEWITEGLTTSGRILQTIGLQAPILHPESAVIVSLKAV